MTIRESLESLKVTKQAIRNAIQEKGVEVPLDTTFREYANKIAQIETSSAPSEDYLSYKEQILSELNIAKPSLPEKYARLKTILEADTHVGTTKITMLVHKHIGMLGYFDAVGSNEGLRFVSDNAWYSTNNDGIFYNGDSVSFSNSSRNVDGTNLETVFFDGEEYFYLTFVSSQLTSRGLCYFIRENRDKCVGMYVSAPEMSLEALEYMDTYKLADLEYFDISTDTALTYKILDVNKTDINLFDSYILLKYGFEFIKRIPYSEENFYKNIRLFRNCVSLEYVELGNITWNKPGYLTIMDGEQTGSLKKVTGNITCLPLEGDDQAKVKFGGFGSLGRYMFEGNIETYSDSLSIYGPAYIKGNITIDSKNATSGLNISGKLEYIEGDVNLASLTIPTKSEEEARIFPNCSLLRVIEGDININVYRRHVDIFGGLRSNAPTITGAIGITCNNDTAKSKNLYLYYDTGVEVVKNTTINVRGYSIHVIPRGCRLVADTFNMVAEDCWFEIGSNSASDSGSSNIVLFEGTVNALVNASSVTDSDLAENYINTKIFNGGLTIVHNKAIIRTVVLINSEYIGGKIDINTAGNAGNIFTGESILFNCDFKYHAATGEVGNLLPFRALNESGKRYSTVKINNINKFVISNDMGNSSIYHALVLDGIKYLGVLDLTGINVNEQDYLCLGCWGSDLDPGYRSPNTSFKVKIGGNSTKIRIVNYNEETYKALAENAESVVGEHIIRVKNIVFDKCVSVENPPVWVTTLQNKGWTILGW